LGVLFERAVDGSAGDKVALCQLVETVVPLTIAQDGVAIKIERLSPDVPALELGLYSSH
jgi:hypothetical protein